MKSATGSARNRSTAIGGGDLIYRFQRVSPMEVSPHDPHTVYYGSQYLHRTRDGGVTWEKISPDLTAHPPGGTQGASGEPITRDATGEEVYSTLYAIRESPLQKGLIWTGSNDGPVYVTRDDGKTWTNVTPKDLPPGGRMQNIEPSPHKPGTAYVAVYRFLLGDFAPYIYRTDDFGKTWTRLTDGKNGIAADEPTRVVREDPDRAGLLYAGTEFGMYISFDNGAHWQSFQLNLPQHAGDRYQGRAPGPDPVHAGPLLLDSRQPDAAASVRHWRAHHPRHRCSSRARPSARHPVEAAAAAPAIQYPQPGAQIDYYVATAPAGDITMEILDASGDVIRKFTSAGAAAREAPAAEVAPRHDEEAEAAEDACPQRSRPVSIRPPACTASPGTCAIPAPWQSPARPEWPNGPAAVPGKYSVRLTVGTWTAPSR